MLTRCSTALPSAVKLNFSLLPPPRGVVSGAKRDAAPPLILVHGLLGSRTNWRTFGRRPEFGGERQVYSVDMRNHGDSPWDNEMTVAALASDLHHFLDTHEIEKAIFLGHSMGGKAVMATSLLFPERVAGLIVADMAPVSLESLKKEGNAESWASVQRVLDAATAMDLSKVTNRLQADELLRDGIPDDATRSFVLQNLQSPRGDDNWHWRCNLPVLRQSLSTLGNFDWPNCTFDGDVCFVGGSRADYLHPEMLPSLQRLFPNATLDMLDAGHWLHFERPDEFADTVRRRMQQWTSLQPQ